MVRSIRWSLAGLVMFSMTVASSHSAENKHGQKNVSPSRTAHRTLPTQADRLDTNRPSVDPAVADADLETMTIDELIEEVKAHTELLAAHAKDIGELQGWRNELRETLETQRKILEALSRTDSAGQTIPRLDQNSDEFRAELKSAVQGTYRDTGTVTIRNSTSRSQEVWINNQRYYLESAQTQDFPVSTGTATVEVPGGERTTWSIGPPDYKAEMTLVPDRRRSTTYYYYPTP